MAVTRGLLFYITCALLGPGAATAQGIPQPVVFLLQGGQSEVSAVQNGAVVTPQVQPSDMAGRLFLNGKGTVNYLSPGGVSFGPGGQQRTDSAFYGFTGSAVQKLFDPFSAGDVSFTWTSRYSFAERQAIVTQTNNRNIFRIAFDVYNDASPQTSISVTIQDGYLAFVWHVSSTKGAYYFVPQGTEDALFGKNVPLNVRIAWDGIGQSYLYLNDVLAEQVPYGRSRAGWANASFSIGASDMRNFGGGFFASDDAISNFTVHNGGRIPIPPPAMTVSPRDGATVSGQTTVQVTAASSIGVSSVSLLIDGAAAGTLRAYPYVFPWNTRALANGAHRVEIVATDVFGGSSTRDLTLEVQNHAPGPRDHQPPGSISGFRTARVTSSEIVFQWNPPEAPAGVAYYEVFRDGADLGRAAAADAASYDDTGLTAGKTYSYQVMAVDLAGDRSPLSSPLAITTKVKDGRVLRVGPGADYAKPCAALSVAAAYDTVEIDAAGNDTYDGDVCSFNVPSLTVRGVNGRARIDAMAQSAGDKATWVVGGADNTIENIELSGAVSGSANGAGIRVEGPNLPLRNVYFHHNQDGLLTANVGGSLLIEYSEFAFNGDGTGQTHNLYINGVDRFTLQFSYSHDASIGHLVKSRAAQTYLLYNRLTGENGTESYEIDIPNGGPTYVIGNLIEQAPHTDNNIFVSYGIEGIPSPRVSSLYMVQNTFVNDYPSCVIVHMPDNAAPAIIQNNILPACDRMSLPPSGSTFLSNVTASPALFIDAADYDYRLVPNSAAAGAATPPQAVPGGPSLVPAFEYVHPSGGRVRPASGSLAAGAYQTDVRPGCATGSTAPCPGGAPRGGGARLRN